MGDLKLSTWMQIEAREANPAKRRWADGSHCCRWSGFGAGRMGEPCWLRGAVVVDGVDPTPDRREPAPSIPEIRNLAGGTEGCWYPNMAWKMGWSVAAAELAGWWRKMAWLGGKMRGEARRKQEMAGIGGGHQRISSSGEHLFGASQKFGQKIGPLLELWFSVFYPKVIIRSVFWALLKML
jgi:hypothetical protein